ncbi:MULTISPECIES: hypothetical protein [unclassified Streptomyces]|uniref:hypothetical protein n=1 Tax=unclassified Streptomyces TaxID=2593676 RepID=UPI001BE88C6E|nr:MULTISPECIES: hypothetical protein [unclassified Streptomyces]MBT2405587.1 hypothetical protein [Streptomyces sp. ISL-21]MBT2607733.1 hypothetical protein [Streptomyces sp. ISL-87]
MTAVIHETASPLPGTFVNDDAMKGRVHFGLRRSLASEAVTDELYDDLETILGEGAVRLSLRRSAAIADRLRTTSTKLVEVVPLLIKPYPLEQQSRMMDQLCAVAYLSVERPSPDRVHGHLVRFASSILTLLDQLGDVAS